MSKHGFIAPLSYQQRELWIAEQLKTRTNTYVISTSYKIEGNLNVNSLEESINKVVERHEILRTVFKTKKGLPILFIQEERMLSVKLIDVCKDIDWSDNNKINEAIFSQELIPMSLTEGPLLRVTLFKIAEENYLMLIEIHHLICDGWSLNIFMNELFHFYNQITQNTSGSLPALSIQYSDYTSWENQYFEKNNFDESLIYWKNILNDAPKNIELPVDYPYSVHQKNEGDVVFFEFPLKLSKEIKKLSIEKEVSLFTMLLSGFGVLLSQYSHQKDMIIGTTVAKRNKPELENLIGFFVDFVALRLNHKKDKKFTDFLLTVKRNILEGFSNNQLPFSKIIDELNLQKDSSFSSFFQVMFIFQNMPVVEARLNNLQITPYKNNNLTAKYDITVEVREEDEKIAGLLQYNTGIFKKNTIQKMIDAYMEIFESIVLNADVLIGQINGVTKADKHEFMHLLNDTKVEFKFTPSIIDLFDATVKKQEHETAVVFQNKTLTYKELDELSNSFANFLKTSLKITNENRVAIKMQRSEQLLVVILGILKLGATYVPLDLNYPDLLLNEMINDSDVKAVIDTTVLEEFNNHINTYSTAYKNVFPVKEDATIAILYTTGSSGKPKGVTIKNSNLYNRFNWMWSEFPFEDNDVCVAKTSFSFVDHLWEIFGPLLKGVKLVIFDKSTVINIPKFINELASHKITRIVLVPSLLKEMLRKKGLCSEKLTLLKEWTSSGEVLNTSLVEKFYETFPNSRLLNIYGSTEVTADATVYDTSLNKEIRRTTVPIGKPIYNTKVFILDNSRNLLPKGAIGEICINGIGVTDGYYKNDTLNTARFFSDPSLTEGLLYKTGDFGRWLSDGNIEYIGRKDNQIKIMGTRIDLIEIKTLFMTLPNIEDAIVVGKQSQNGNNILAVFFTATKKINVAEARADFSEKVRNYMLPTIFIQLDDFPLLSNGKIDEKSLKSKDFNTNKNNTIFLSPTNEIEKKLIILWSAILEIPPDKIGLLDNFFELGGNSIKLLSLVTKLKLNFDKELKVIDVFKYVNIKSQAQFLIDQEEYNGISDDEIKTSHDLLMDTIDKFLD